MNDRILIRGARQNNLKGFDLDLPHNSLIVISGLSGSGKSSLAFDTLYAEGQRRFIESQSTYSRQFLQRLDKPAVEAIEGLPPTIAVRSRNAVKSSRSTVGTVTEIYDYLRLLYAKIGEPHCPDCDIPVAPETVDQIADAALRDLEGCRATVMFPLELSEKATFPLVRDIVRARGFSYILLNGETIDLEEAPDDMPGFGGGEPPRAYVMADRLRVEEKKRGRLVDSLETALKSGEGVCCIMDEEGKMRSYTERLQCRACGRKIKSIQPTDLSFNSPLGACEACLGFGDVYGVDENLVVPDKALSVKKGAIEPFSKPRFRRYLTAHLERYCSEVGFRTGVPYRDLTDEERRVMWEGGPNFLGILPFFERLKAKSYKPQNRFFLKRYQSLSPCGVCKGARIKRDGLFLKLRGRSIYDLCLTPMEQFAEFFGLLKLTAAEEEISRIILKEIRGRSEYLTRIGLGYLTLHRLSRTLSGGEMQRIHLASYLGSRLTGSLYVLDEPTVGLHQRDTERLIEVLKDIRDCGNSVVVVEHDLQVIGEADHVVEMGPESGERGGDVIFQGGIREFKECGTRTAEHLRGKTRARRKAGAVSGNISGWIELKGVAEHNLAGINVRIPHNRLTCVTGVSGSGKSSLVCDVLYPAMAGKLGRNVERVGKYGELKGWKTFEAVELVDQEPISRTPRSNAATYLEFFTPIRELFAASPDAKARGFSAGHFSFNSPLGQCERCGGDGQVKIDMQFLADAWAICETCEGRRYKSEVLKVRFNGKTIQEALSLSVDQALEFFSNSGKIAGRLRLLQNVGLGYLRLGQPLNALSGGEAQRIKIAAELGRSGAGRTLYLFDEPTTGLHPVEVEKLLECFDRLLAAGHTVVVIEHNLQVIGAADYAIDLGPEGGEAGGRVVAEGKPQDLMKCAWSHTGQCLKKAQA